MSFEIVRRYVNDLQQEAVVVSNGKLFFPMFCQKDGSYTRTTSEGLTLQTRDLDYAAVGAKLSNTLEKAAETLHERGYSTK